MKIFWGTHYVKLWTAISWSCFYGRSNKSLGCFLKAKETRRGPCTSLTAQRPGLPIYWHLDVISFVRRPWLYIYWWNASTERAPSGDTLCVISPLHVGLGSLWRARKSLPLYTMILLVDDAYNSSYFRAKQGSESSTGLHKTIWILITNELLLNWSYFFFINIWILKARDLL